MKLSLSWIFDHLIGTWKQHDIHDLIDRFNQTTAEIESITSWRCNFSHIYAAIFIEYVEQGVRVMVPEAKKEYFLPIRPDLIEGGYYLITIKGNESTWTTLSELGSSKDGLMPQISMKHDQEKGGWKRKIEQEDFIIEIDNKSITNRPDLWCHRGIAREIAALYDLSLVPIEQLITFVESNTAETCFKALPELPFTLENTIPQLCIRFAGMYISQIPTNPSDINIALRMLRLDARPINATVDASNYVMLDMSQPLHAFDAKKIVNKKIEIKLAGAGNFLQLLDNTQVELSAHDIVISDGKNPLALAGIMGGASTAVDQMTTELFVESACFDATTIRKSAQRHKKRTEASVRFEKSLDPMQNIVALQRFMYLLQKQEILSTSPAILASLGKEVYPPIVIIAHEYIEQKIGADISTEFIEKILSKIEFIVSAALKENRLMYDIFVPTFRATKDIELDEDIVEEVARFYGFNRIKKKIPRIRHLAQKKIQVIRERSLKELVAFGLHAREVYNYAIFDESFLHKISWQPTYAVEIVNPISNNWRRLVTSLIPHLIKNVVENEPEHEALRFFEYNRTWHQLKKEIIEQHKLAGIFFEKKNKIDFYTGKSYVQVIFDQLRTSISWRKPEKNTVPVWCHPYQTAQLYVNDQLIGYAGNLDDYWLESIVSGSVFVFELDIQELQKYAQTDFHAQQLSKYPRTSFDLSMLVPLEIMFDQIKHSLLDVHAFIKQVDLLDYFEKDKWIGQKSITVRCYVQSKEKTLTKQDIDQIYQKTCKAMQRLGAEIR